MATRLSDSYSSQYSLYHSEPSFAHSPLSTTTSETMSTCSSPPVSPMSTVSDPPSPAASWASDSEESTITTTTTVQSKKRSSNHFADETTKPMYQTFVNKKPKYATKYDEMLQPLSPMTMLPIESLNQPQSYLMVKPNVNSELQKEFRNLLDSRAKLSEVESFLSEHSETIDINEYNSDGRTALQQCCFDGNLPALKVLVRYGADVKLTTREGFSALHIAAFTGYSNVLLYIMSLRR